MVAVPKTPGLRNIQSKLSWKDTRRSRRVASPYKRRITILISLIKSRTIRKRSKVLSEKHPKRRLSKTSMVASMPRQKLNSSSPAKTL